MRMVSHWVTFMRSYTQKRFECLMNRKMIHTDVVKYSEPNAHGFLHIGNALRTVTYDQFPELESRRNMGGGGQDREKIGH